MTFSFRLISAIFAFCLAISQTNGSQSFPSITLNFEFADGSEVNGPQGDGGFLYPGYGNIPSDLHAKEHKNIMLINCNWNKLPIRPGNGYERESVSSISLLRRSKRSSVESR